MSTPARHRRGALAAILVGALFLSACAGGGGQASDDDAVPASTEAADEAAADGGVEEAAAADGTCAPDEITLIGQVRNQTNPYEAAWLEGGDAFAESVGLEQQKLTYDGDSQRQQEQIRQALAGGDLECTVLNVLPNGDADTAPIVVAADQAGAWLVTQWNKPAELDPADYERWVAHITYDGVESGYLIAQAMIEAMGGSG